MSKALSITKCTANGYKTAKCATLLICLNIFGTAANAAEMADKFYHSRFFQSGFVLRAGVVCGSKEMIESGARFIGTPELSALARGYTTTTKSWMAEGAKTFNDIVMAGGIVGACKMAADKQREMDSSANEIYHAQ